MLHSMRWKLAASLLLIVVLSVGITAFLISMSMEREFQQYISTCDTAYLDQLQSYLSNYYGARHGWDGIQEVLEGQVNTATERLVLASDDGLVLADTRGEWLNQDIADFGIRESFVVSSNGIIVARVYSIIYAGIDGATMVGDRCSGQAVLTAAEESFISKIKQYLWIAGLLGVAMALFLGLVLTRQFTAPLIDLKQGSQQLAKGNLGFRVKVDSKDEFGEVARSFNSMSESLERIEQSRRRLTADIAHELRTPLTVIDGTIQGMMDGVFQPDHEHLGLIKNQTRLLSNLINDLRDLSLAESGQLKLNKTSVHIAEFIKSIVSRWDSQACAKEIRLSYDAADNMALIEADPVRVEQIINNLLSNAVRYTPKGGEIKVALNNSPAIIDNKPGVVVTVADNGDGIPSQHLEHVFDRFYRADSSRSKSGKETGLGLAIVRQMVEAHGGKVWAESTFGKGSKFYIFLPLPI